jgi:pimeloyl-ACP methyl ester carboxylesterase
MALRTVEHRIPNGDGWELSLFQTWSEERLVAGRNPVLIVPGYGMNSFIFSYHPNGLSLEGYLVEAGFEVWRADLRAQGGSRPLAPASSGRARDALERFGLEDLALTDLGAAIDAVLARARTGGARVDLIGASLGGTLLFLHAVLGGEEKLGSLVALGSPVRWVKIHPALRLAFASPMLVGLVRFRGTRRLAEIALPLLARHTPWLISIYMTPSITDVSAAREMVKTVEDPNRFVNRQIARWIRDRDLVVDGRNVTEGLSRVTRPLLCVVADGDGIVPRETAEYPVKHVSSAVRRVLAVDGDQVSLAHADMFVSNEAHRRVFEPLARWLEQPS